MYFNLYILFISFDLNRRLEFLHFYLKRLFLHLREIHQRNDITRFYNLLRFCEYSTMFAFREIIRGQMPRGDDFFSRR